MSQPPYRNGQGQQGYGSPYGQPSAPYGQPPAYGQPSATPFGTGAVGPEPSSFASYGGQPPPGGQPTGFGGAYPPPPPPVPAKGRGVLIGLIVGALALLLVLGGVGLWATSLRKPAASAAWSSAAPSPLPSGMHRVEYKVKVKGGAEVTYTDATGKSITEGVDKDWSKTVDVPDNLLVSVSVMSDVGVADDVECEVLVDGQSMERNSGVFALCMTRAK